MLDTFDLGMAHGGIPGGLMMGISGCCASHVTLNVDNVALRILWKHEFLHTWNLRCLSDPKNARNAHISEGHT